MKFFVAETLLHHKSLENHEYHAENKFLDDKKQKIEKTFNKLSDDKHE